VFTVK